MLPRSFSLVSFACASFTSIAAAQTTFVESEPNNGKSEADAVVGIVAGDAISGTTTGFTTTLGSTLATTVDVFRVKTAALPLGLYEHRLTLTTTTVGHTGSIRGLNQTGTVGVGGVAGTIDTGIQTTITTSTPPRFNRWYGFGKQEEIYYRVDGTAATTAPYTATLTTTPVTPTVIAPVFESTAPVTISTVGLTFEDTELLLYDANFVPIAANDHERPGTSAQSRITRTLTAGVYYVAVSTFELCSDQVASADDNFVTGWLTDFPDCVVLSNTEVISQDYDFEIRACNGTYSQTNQSPVGTPYEVTWFQFTVAPGAPPISAPVNDACASATVLTTPATITASLSTATNDATATCDTGGAASRDVWYSFTNALAVPSRLRLNTCASGTTDTVVTVFSSCGGTELACSDDCTGSPCSGPSSCISLDLALGQSVLIRVSDRGLGGCEFTLSLSNIPIPPANDECSTPTSISGFGLFPINSLGATTGVEGQTEALCNQFGSAMAQDVWYTWTATASGTVEVTTCGLIASGPSQDSHIGVYNGTGCPANGTAIACNDDSLTGCTGFSSFNARTIFTAVCGNVYTIQMGMYPFTTATMAGQFSITLTAPGGPPCNTPSTPFCDGAGVGTSCLGCGNNGAAGRGCANSSFASGALLVNGGISSVGADTMTLTGSDMTGPGLFFQATGLAAGPITFGDGMLCAASGIIRMGVVFPTAGVATYPGGLTPAPIGSFGATAGTTLHYQCWYRDAVAFCTAATFNLTNGLSLTWTL